MMVGILHYLTRPPIIFMTPGLVQLYDKMMHNGNQLIVIEIVLATFFKANVICWTTLLIIYLSNSIKLLLKNLNTVVKSWKIKMNQQYQQYQRRFDEARGEENGVNMFNNNTHDCIYGCSRYILSSDGWNLENGEKTIWPRDIFMMIERWNRRMVVSGLPSISSPKFL